MATSADAYPCWITRDSKNLVSLTLNLLFFALDVGDNVAKNIHRGYSRITRSRHGLHRRDNYSIDAKFIMQRLQRQSQDGRGAVRIGDNEAITFLMSLLLFYQASVISV